MSKVLLVSLALTLFASTTRAAVLHEVFLSSGPDGASHEVPDAVEIDQINTHSELTLLVLNAADSGAWGSVVDGFTLNISQLNEDDNTVLISDGEFPQEYGGITAGPGTRPIVDISDPGSSAVTVLGDSPAGSTGWLDFRNARLLVLLAGRVGQSAVGNVLKKGDFDTDNNTLNLGDDTTADVLDLWGFDGQQEEIFGFPIPPGRDPDDKALKNVRGSSVLIRDPDALTFVDGNSDEDGYLAGTSPRIRITPGVSNPSFASSPPPGGAVVPEPTAAGLIALGVSVLLGHRRPRPAV